MSVKLHYRVFISNVGDRTSKWDREKENSGSYGNSKPLSFRSRPLLCSLNQACWGHCAHWEEDEQGHTRLCGLGSKRGGGGLHWQKTTNQEPQRSPWQCRHTDRVLKSAAKGGQQACENSYNPLPLEFNLSLKSINPITTFVYDCPSDHRAGCMSGAK